MCQVSVVCMHGNVKVDFNLVKSVGFALPLMGLKSEIRISKYETISKPECEMIKTFPALIQYIHDSDMFWILNFGHSYFFRISCLGLPWRNLPGALCCRCNFSGVESIELSPCKPGLGQGFRIYNKLIKQIILKLYQFTSLNDLVLCMHDGAGSLVGGNRPYLAGGNEPHQYYGGYKRADEYEEGREVAIGSVMEKSCKPRSDGTA